MTALLPHHIHRQHSIIGMHHLRFRGASGMRQASLPFAVGRVPIRDAFPGFPVFLLEALALARTDALPGLRQAAKLRISLISVISISTMSMRPMVSMLAV